MSLITGQNVILQFYKDGGYQTYLCSDSCSIDIETVEDEITTITDGKWPVFEGDALGYSVACTGLIELDEATPVAFWLLQQYQMQLLPVPFKMIFTDSVTSQQKVASGNLLIKTTSLVGPAADFASASFSFKGSGPLDIADASTTCSGTIENLRTDGPLLFPPESVASFKWDDVSAEVTRLDWSIDDGGRDTVFVTPGIAGQKSINDLPDGTYTLHVWPICENGIEGTPYDLIFTIAGGMPTTCGAPGTPVMSALTGTEATATWAPPMSPPAGGYFWQLKGALGTVLQSGYRTDPFVDLTGLTDGWDYTFEVKSLCEEGVSESGYSSVGFTSEAPPACNVPGAPVMSAITDTTATATWTAPTPTPGDGYHWELVQGVSVVQSGDTSSLSTNLTGLDPDTSYTFRVKSICDTGVSESGYNSVGFDTTLPESSNQVQWSYINPGGLSTFFIRVNGSPIVTTGISDFGSFITNDGDNIEVEIDTSDTGTINAVDQTTSTTIFTEVGTGTVINNFNTADGHDYLIQGSIGL